MSNAPTVPTDAVLIFEVPVYYRGGIPVLEAAPNDDSGDSDFEAAAASAPPLRTACGLVAQANASAIADSGPRHGGFDVAMSAR